MGFLVSPGVEVKEIDLTNSIAALSTAIGGYAGRFTWGPVGQIVQISTEKDLVETFGAPNDPSSDDVARSFFTAASFLRYGNSLKVVRSENDDALNAASTDATATFIKDEDALSNLNLDAGVYARHAGKLGNGLTLEVVTSGNFDGHDYEDSLNYKPSTTPFGASFKEEGLNDEVHVVVVDTQGKFSGNVGSILEIFEGLSLGRNAKTVDGATNYVVDAVNRRSRYVYVSKLDELILDGTSPVSITADADAFTIGAGAVTTFTCAGGNDGTVAPGNIMDALDEFSNAETVDVNFLFADLLVGEDDVTDAQTIANHLVTIAETRRDIVSFISAPYTLYEETSDTEKLDKVKGFFDGVTPSTYAIFDSSPVQMYNRYADRFIWVPSAGHMAGLCANTDFVSEPWFSPAGYNRGQLRNVLRLAYNPNNADRDKLYKLSVNPLVSFPGQGIVLFGDKTAGARPSAFDRINVRRLFIILQKAIATFSKFQLFELNDDFTRSAFVAAVEPFLRDIQGRRGIIDFRVICDTSNNTPQVIDTNRFVADIYIKPERSINFITLNFIATRTGVEFKEIIGE